MLLNMIMKDVKRMLRDRKALLITLLMPAILTAILGLSVGKLMTNEHTLDIAKVAVVIDSQIEKDTEQMNRFLLEGPFHTFITEDQRNQMIPVLKQLDFQDIFVNQVLENKQVKSFITYELMNKNDAKAQLEKEKLTAIIVFPEHFNFNMWISLFFPLQNRTEIEIIQNPKEEIKAEIVKTVVQGFTNKLSAGIISKNAFTEVGIEAGFNQEMLYSQASMLTASLIEESTNSFQFKSIPVEGMKKINGFQYYAAAMAVMFILFTAVYSANYCLDEKQFFTFERMKTAGVSLFTILASRFFASILFTMLQLGVLITFSTFVFQVYWGSIGLNLLLVIAASTAIGGLSVLLSMINLITEDERVANLFQGAIIPLISLIGGSFISTSTMPKIVQQMGDYTPNGITLDGFLKIMQGYGFAELQSVLGTLTIFAFVCVVITGGIAKLKEV